jgi:hypothetical protein
MQERLMLRRRTLGRRIRKHQLHALALSGHHQAQRDRKKISEVSVFQGDSRKSGNRTAAWRSATTLTKEDASRCSRAGIGIFDAFMTPLFLGYRGLR